MIQDKVALQLISGHPCANLFSVLCPFLQLGWVHTACKHCLKLQTNAEPQTPESDPQSNYCCLVLKKMHLLGNKKWGEIIRTNKPLKHELILTWLQIKNCMMIKKSYVLFFSRRLDMGYRFF